MAFLKAGSILVALIGVAIYILIKINSDIIDEVVIETKQGSIKGYTSLSRNGRVFTSFRSIPYAKPPIGPLRFKPPVELQKWSKEVDGTKVAPNCPQVDSFWKKLDGVEDCLFLNVFTPRIFKKDATDDNKLYPIIVFIHGGYFMYGGSDVFGPQYFLEEEVVLITINYRLGALGFLNIGPEAKGNMGLKDQVMALRWIKNNIEEYGGNPNSVTIMGESAGGASVNYHMLSPMSEGLFHKAISHSGTSLCPWSRPRTSTIEQGKELGRRLNCPTKNVNELTKCLIEIDANEIVKTQFGISDPFHTIDEIYGPSIDFDTGDDDEAEDIFVYEDTKLSAQDGQFARVPYILGSTQQEGCFKTAYFIDDQPRLSKFYDEWNETAPVMLIYEKDDFLSLQIKDFYFGKDKKNFTRSDYEAMTNLFSDRYFVGCTKEAALYHSKNSPTYLYQLNYDSGFGIGLALANAKGQYPVILELIWTFLKTKLYKATGLEFPEYGICHVDDLQYFFKMVYIWNIDTDSPHYEFSKNLIKMWVNFAQTGEPSELYGVKWEKADPKSNIPNYFSLTQQPKMIPEPFTKRLEFWNSLHV